MIGFALAATLLLAVALAAILLPLLRTTPPTPATQASALSLAVLREQLSELDNERRAGTLDAAQYDNERAEIERRAIEDAASGAAPTASEPQRPTALAASLAVAVTALAVGLYVVLGTPAVLQETASAPGKQNSHAVTPQQIQAMVERLADRLQENPNDGEGWLMLARSYNALGRFPEGAAAFGRAAALLPPDAQLLADYADTLAMAQGRKLAGEPERIIQRALAVDPTNLKALALAGSAAFDRRDYAKAITEWQRALAVVPPDSSVADRLRNSIADAQAKSGQAPTAATTPAPTAKTANAATGARVGGLVSLAPELKAKAGPNDTVFIFARAVNGPRMPLAIQRLTVKDLPARFNLDDSMGMAGGPRLSSQPQVTVGARISRSGNATPQPGDLEGQVDSVAVGKDNIQLTISTTRP